MQPNCNIAPKRASQYICETCVFTCSEKNKYTRHLLTAKHQNATKYNEQPIDSETEIFECLVCKYVTNRNSDYTRHLQTDIHKQRTKCNTPAQTRTPTRGKFDCDCGKTYTHRSSFWVHRQRCTTHIHAPSVLVPTEIDSSEKVKCVLSKSHIFRTIDPDDDDMTSTIEAIVNSKVKEQMEMQGEQKLYSLFKAQMERDDMRDEAQTKRDAAAAEQMRLLIEAISLKGPQCITNNNNNTTNNQFNLNVFLNEDCKNAFTFKDVIESIVCTVDDLDRLIVEGYAATVIRKMLESMQDMTITERPIHCTDLRRNTVCVKSATGWEKGAAALKRLNNSLYFIGKKLGNVVPEWRETYPDHFRGTDLRRNQYHKLIVEVLKVDDVKLEDRNVGIICRSLVLDRKTAKVGIM